MKNLAQFLLRTAIIVIFVSLVTGAAYLLSGGQTKVGLSDWLVVASFVTLTIGTFAGIFRLGYKGNINEEAASGEMGAFERVVKEFFRAGPFGGALTLAGPLCFVVEMLVDILF